ncbi:MAG TPA: PAS domain S-box protein [Gallionella sp.]|nr:PAS domain S-box protein [Gallionella sp.]
MEHGYILSILYEMALVIGSEVSVRPLLTRMLQRLLYHTSFPAGFVCLSLPVADEPDGMVEVHINAAVGDYELAGLVGKPVRLPARLLRGAAERGEDDALLAALPGKSRRYLAYLRLPIDGQGVVVLLAPHLPDTDLPLTQLFEPVMANLAKAIVLCSYHDAYTGQLIAARDASQQALAASEEKFRAISAAALDALIMVDDTGTLVYWNPAAERILGYRADEALGKPLHQLLTPQRYRSQAMQGFETFRSSGQGALIGKAIEIEALHKDGHEIPVELSISALQLNGRRYAVGILRDISERKQAEQELRLLAAIVASSDDAIISKSLDGTILSWNAGAERLYGYSAAEMIGRPVSRLAPSDRPDEIPGLLERIRQGERIEHYETVRRRKDGVHVPMSLTISPLHDAAGQVVGASAIGRDITQRKQAEEALRHANAYNRSLIEASPDPLVTIGPDGRITDVNSATEQVTGHSREELIGTDFSDYFTYPEHARAGYQQVFRDGIVRDYPLEIQHRDGYTTPVLYNAAVYRDEAGQVTGVFAAARDVTELRHAEQKLRHSEAGLKEAQRIALLGNWELDLATNALSWSDEIYRIFELDPKKFGASYDAFLNGIHPDDRNMVNQAYTDSVKNRTPYDIVHRLLMPDGRIKYVHERCETHYSEAGQPLRSIGTVQDITTQRLAELNLQKSNRALHALSACNGALVRATDEAWLLNDICNLLVEIGTYPLAWVGFAEQDAEKNVRVMARAGAQADYLDHIRVTWSDNPEGQGPTGTAIRTGQLQMAQDILHDPKFLPWREQATARGYACSIALPLFDNNDRPFGVLNLYGKEPNAFDADEIRLLQELAGDLAFGIRMLRLRAERDHLHEQQLHHDETVRQALAGTIQAIAVTVEKRDPYTAGHQRRVANLSVAIAMELGLSEERITGLRLGATIHDIGKIYVPAEILTRPGELTQMERDFIRIHPQVGYDIMKDVKLPWPVAEMILQHHERVDGSGYPHGLKGDEILLEARILTVADVTEAMMSHRPYRPSLGLDAALAEIEKYRGIYYDPDVVDACIRLFREKGFRLEQ